MRPVPLSATCWGEPTPGYSTSRRGVNVPAILGWKVIMIVQVDPAGRLDPQLLVSVKFAAPRPADGAAMPIRTARGVVPTLVRFADCGVLAVPTFWFPNERLSGCRSIGA